MGWWTQDELGHSFRAAEGAEMFWGDSVADTMDEAIDNIVADFVRDQGRQPTKAELRAGLEFSLGSYDEKGEADDAQGRDAGDGS